MIWIALTHQSAHAMASSLAFRGQFETSVCACQDGASPGLVLIQPEDFQLSFATSPSCFHKVCIICLPVNQTVSQSAGLAGKRCDVRQLLWLTMHNSEGFHTAMAGPVADDLVQHDQASSRCVLLLYICNVRAVTARNQRCNAQCVEAELQCAAAC